MKLNKNNFLQFSGSWTPNPFDISGYFLAFPLFANVDSVVIQPLASATASNGIDYTSYRIIAIKDGFGTDIELSQECQYDGAGNLTVYRPVDLSVTAIYIYATFTDVLGNPAPVGFFFDASQLNVVNISPIITAWEAHPASASCVLDTFGNNNGYIQWGQLRLYNTGSGLPISPLTLKPNIISDADYIAPEINLGTCPLAYGSGDYAPLFISNFSKNSADTNPNNYITITNITLACTACGAGGTPIVLNIPCTIAPGQTQRFNVPANAWDTGLTLTYSVAAGGNMATASPLRYWYSNTNGVVAGFPAPATVVDNTGTFGNNAITVPFPNGITIYAQ